MSVLPPSLSEERLKEIENRVGYYTCGEPVTSAWTTELIAEIHRLRARIIRDAFYIAQMDAYSQEELERARRIPSTGWDKFVEQDMDPALKRLVQP